MLYPQHGDRACPFSALTLLVGCRGGATVLKVGEQILRPERAENFFLTPHFLASGGQNIA